MAWQNIALSVENDGIALLTVSRPEKLNALNRLTMNEIASALSELSANEAVKGLILTGAGEKAFVAGADISELAEGYVSSVHDVCKVGDVLQVKVIAIDDQDCVKLSRKAALKELAAPSGG